MKNLLNRLTRILIIALLLVDRTPFLNVYAKPGDGGVLPTVLTPTSLAVGVNKPDVTGSVIANTYWGIIKTVDKPVLNLAVDGNENVTYTVDVSQTTDITFSLTYTVTYELTGTTPADFSVRSLIAHPSGSPIYSEAVIDTFTDVADQTITETYTTSFTINEAVLETISPFKITIQIFGETDLTNTGLSILTPAINVKNPDVINADGTLTVTDPMDLSSPRVFTLPAIYTYVHNIDQSSMDPVTVNNTATGTTSGGTILTSSAAVLVNTINAIPVADPQTLNTNEEVPIGITLTGSDADVSQVISFVDVGTPANGVLSGTLPNLTYTPNLNFFGSDSFTFRVNDGYANSAYATITINVANLDDLPVAVDDVTSTDEEVAIDIDVLLNDTDIDAGLKEVTSVTSPSNGTAVENPNGTIKYTPNANFVGVDTFTYTLNGGSVATVTVTVNPIDDAPVAVNDVATTDEDVEIDINVIANDTDIDSGPLMVTLVGSPAHGTAVLNLDGTIKYTPTADYFGPDQFTYTINGGSIATVFVTVNPINDLPIANPDEYTTTEDIQLVVAAPGVKSNDSDVENNGLSVSLVIGSEPVNGVLVLNPDGSFTYTPYANFHGTDSFVYRITDGNGGTATALVTLNITSEEDNPVANPKAFDVLEGGTYNGSVTGQDDDGDALTFELVGSPANGTIDLNGLGVFEYVHDGSETSSDSFTFRVSDDGGVTFSAPATVSITVLDFNDAPDADPQTLNTPEDIPLPITLTGSDPEGTTLTFDIETGPLHGVLSGTGENRTYTPDANYFGPDSFTFEVSDGEKTDTAVVTITVTAVNDRPIADPQDLTTPEETPLPITLTGSDTEGSTLVFGILTGPAHGVLTGTGANRTYTPDLNYTGPDSFTFALSDGFYRASATITIDVTPLNDRPVAEDDEVITDEDTPILINFVASDVDGDSLIYGITEAPLHGTLSGTGASRTYTPDADYHGPDSFMFGVSDGKLRAYATVTITVNPINDAPVAVGDNYDTPEDTALVIAAPGVLINDSDVDGDSLTPSIQTSTLFGSLLFNVDGSFTYTPNENYVGLDSFDYLVSDGLLDSNVVTVVIDVTPVNDPPVANPLAFIVPNAGSSNGLVTASDLDVPADTLVFSLLTPATNGTATVSPTGEYTYTHNGSATLSDTFVFSVTDGQLTSTATVTVTVLAAPVVNLPPVAFAQALTVLTGGTVGGTLTGSDPEGAPLSFSLLSGTANGSVVVNVDGTFSYTHNGGATTSDSFLFEVFDGVHTSNATVTITVTTLPPPPAPNGAPVVVDDTLSTPFEEPVDGAATGTDPDGDALTFSLVTDPTNGTIVFNPDGTFTYTPNDGFEGTDSFTFIANDGTDDSNIGEITIDVTEEIIIVEPETPLAAVNNDWLWWLLALLAGLLLWLLAFLRPNMKYILTDKANNQKVVRRRLAKPDEKTMVVELSDKDLVEVQTIEIEFFKRLAKHCGGVTVNFQLNGKVIHSATIPEGIDDSFETLIRL